MQVSYDARILTGLLAAAGTVAAFAKSFVPFYLIGSTAIFAAVSALGMALAAVNWRQLRNDASQVPDILVVFALLYTVVVASFLTHSLPAVPVTHLAGILIFHAMFLVFGFAAARAVRTVLLVLVAAAAIYAVIILQHTVRFGDVMRENHINDIFGVGNPEVFNTFHQNIGIFLGLGLLAAFGLVSGRGRLVLASAALPILLLFLFHIAARSALVALACSLIFLGFAACWVRSRKAAALILAVAIIAMSAASAIFYRYGIADRGVNPVAADAMSRTIRELHDSDPGFRIQIWSRALHQIASEPNLLLFGRGIGMFPVNEGYGAPDWLLRPAEGSRHYPHNVYLEFLYETGIAGLLPFAFLSFVPLVASLRLWKWLSPAEKSVISIYVFELVSSQFSGSFARSNIEEFVLALAIGVIALKRAAVTGTFPRPAHEQNSIQGIARRFRP
jgi:O-antigen ligase